MTDVSGIDCPCGGTLVKNANGYFKCARCGGKISTIKLNDLWLEQFKDNEGVKKILRKVLF